MQYTAKARYVSYSPYKLRPLADVIRGKRADYALGWLATYASQRTQPIKKMLQSAIANAKNRSDVSVNDLVIKELRVDQGPIFRYYKPGAMGRANVQRRRFSHISVILESAAQQKSTTQAKED
jgi:large subunit ribosomal protein L22